MVNLSANGIVISQFAFTLDRTIILRGLACMPPDFYSAICATCDHLPSIYGVVFCPSDDLVMNFRWRIRLQDRSLK